MDYNGLFECLVNYKPAEHQAAAAGSPVRFEPYGPCHDELRYAMLLDLLVCDDMRGVPVLVCMHLTIVRTENTQSCRTPHGPLAPARREQSTFMQAHTHTQKKIPHSRCKRPRHATTVFLPSLLFLLSFFSFSLRPRGRRYIDKLLGM